jgi:hypothetical protein
VNERDAPAPATSATSADRLTAASARGYGVVQAISNCARGGLLSPAAVHELNEVYSVRVEPLLRSASILQRTADLVRRLVTAAERIRGGRPGAGETAPEPVGVSPRR